MKSPLRREGWPMKLPCVLILLMFLSLAAGSQAMKVFTRDGLSIVYPGSMNLVEPPSNPGAWVLLRDRAGSPGNAMLFFTCEHNTKHPSSLEFAQSSRQGIQASANSPLPEPRIEKIGSARYYVLQYPLTVRGEPQLCKGYLAYDSRTATGYVWTFTAPPRTFAKDLPTFEKVLSTATYPGQWVPSP